MLSKQHYRSYPILHEMKNSYDRYLRGRRYLGHVQRGIVQVNDASRSALAVPDWQVSAVPDSADTVVFTPEDLAQGMCSLGAAYDVSMGAVLAPFDLRRAPLRSALEQICRILESGQKGPVFSPFQDALRLYQQGVASLQGDGQLQDSLRHLRTVLDGYGQNGIAHLYAGHILHYGERICNFSRALEHYQQCFEVGGRASVHNGVAALGALYAGWLQAAVFGDFKAGVFLTQAALQYDPSLAAAYYHLAKMYAAMGLVAEAMQHLRTAIVDHDKRYARKAQLDSDFTLVQDEFKDLITSVGSREFEQVASRFADVRENLTAVQVMQVEDKLTAARSLLRSAEFGKMIDACLALADARAALCAEPEPRLAAQAPGFPPTAAAAQADPGPAPNADPGPTPNADPGPTPNVKSPQSPARTEGGLPGLATMSIVVLLVLVAASWLLFGLSAASLLLTGLLGLVVCIRMLL